MELETAARRHLLSVSEITGFVGTKVHKGHLDAVLTGTGGMALVVKQAGGWSTATPQSAKKFPLLRVVALADCDRDDEGLMLRANARDKALALLAAVDRALNNQKAVWWGAGADPGRFIIDCVRWAEPTDDRADRYADGDDPMGDVEAVMLRYAITTVEGHPA
jgi:hypothetical protein